MKLRIEFSVREPGTERYVTFGDDVSPGDVRDWFGRAALSVEQLFNAQVRPRAIAARPGALNNKINAIKAVRDVSGIGLRDAKDVVEACAADPSRSLLVCEDERDVPAIVAAFAACGVSVEGKDVDDANSVDVPWVKRRVA